MTNSKEHCRGGRVVFLVQLRAWRRGDRRKSYAMRMLDQVDTESDILSISDHQNGNFSSPESNSRPGNATSGKLRHEFIYDLRIDGQSSDAFYADVAGCSARVVAEIDSRAAAALD